MKVAGVSLTYNDDYKFDEWYNHYKNYKDDLFIHIVVDNNSHDFSGFKIQNEFPEIEFIQNKINLGFTGANNVAIKWAIKNNYEYTMLLNNDTEVDKYFLNYLITTFDNDPLIGAVQPLILEYDNKNIIWNGGGTIDFKFGRFLNPNKGLSKFNFKTLNKVEWISGCCFMIKSDVIKKVGMLDDFFFVYFEDADLSLRINRSGFKLYVENKSLIYHHEGKSWISANKNNEGYISPKTHYLNIRNHIYILKKFKNNFNIIFSIIFQIAKISGYLIYFTSRLRFNKLKKVVYGVKDGLISNILK